MRFLRNRFVLIAVRLVALCLLVGLSGVLAGAAIGWPLGRVNFETSKAVRLDQARLAGSIDPEVVVAVDTDLPIGWKPGDPNVAMFGILNSDFCGEKVDMPAALTSVKSSVFVSPSDDGTLIIQAVRLERWQNAREYVRSVDRTVGDCDKFFSTDMEGNRRRIDIEDGQGDPPITDFVARSYVSEDGNDVQFWSLMAVGDVVIGIRYVGTVVPQHSLLPDLQNHILMRIAPQDFAPGSGDTRTNADGSDHTDVTTDDVDDDGTEGVEEPQMGDDSEVTTPAGGSAGTDDLTGSEGIGD